MRKIKEFLRPWFTQGTAIGILLLILAFQPMIDLDYLIYPFLNQFGLPRPSTIIRYLLIPALIVGCGQWDERESVRQSVGILFLLVGALFRGALGLYRRAEKRSVEFPESCLIRGNLCFAISNCESKA